MGTVFTCSYSPYLAYCMWKDLKKGYLDLDFYHFLFARLFWLEEEIED
jgi:hypothetical protein